MTPSVPSPIPAGTEAEKWWEAVPVGTPVLASFLGSKGPQPARRTEAGWEADDGMVGCTPWSMRPHEVWLPATLAAVVSSPERDSATGLSRSDTNEASSPATPAWTVDDLPRLFEGWVTRLDETPRELIEPFRIMARVAIDYGRSIDRTPSPATPEGGLDPAKLRDGYDHCADECANGDRDECMRIGCRVFYGEDPAPSTLPAETREGSEVVTICGSTKFKAEILAEVARLTLDGLLVISLGVFGHTDLPDYDWTTDGSSLKRMLDELHKRKIDLADRVHVVNPGGYYGDSTRGEIEYARSVGKPVTFMVPASPAVSLPGEEKKP